MAHRTGPGLGWKLFAGFLAIMVLIGDLPRLFRLTSLAEFAMVACYFVAVAGLIAYAAGRQCLPVRFWRVYAPAFCLLCAGQVGWSAPKVAWLVYRGQGSPASVLGFFIVVVPAVSMVVFICIALLRQAELLGPGRRPLGARPEQLSLPLPEPA
jgi:hypothetical protein